MLVSVVVLNYNGAHLLPECLVSLLAQDYSNIEIIVVDNASIDNSKEVVLSYSGVRWLELLSNSGLGPGYNAGFKETVGEKVFFVNNDMRFEPDCISQLVTAFKDKDVLAADPLQMDWEGKKIIHGEQRFLFDWRNFDFGVPFISPYQNYQAKEKINVPWGCAGALMFDSKKFDFLEGFDPTFFLDYEDLDICWRGGLLGWKTIFVPGARLFHKVGESEDSKLRNGNRYLKNFHPPRINLRRQFSQFKNAQRFIIKTMPLKILAVSLIIEMIKIFGSFLRGHLMFSILRVKAIIFNLMELSEILKQRRFIFERSVTTSYTLLSFWGKKGYQYSSITRDKINSMRNI